MNLNIRVYDPADDDFTQWLRGLRFCGLHVAVDQTGVVLLLALVDDDGDGWVIDGTSTPTVTAALRAVAHEGTRLFTFDAHDATVAMLRTHGIRMRGLRDAGLVKKLHDPRARRFETRNGYAPAGLDPDAIRETQRDLRIAWNAQIGSPLKTSTAPRGWVDEALLSLPMRSGALQAYVAAPAHIAAQIASDYAWTALDDVEQRTEEVWRWIAIDGFAVDRDRLNALRGDVDQVRQAARHRHGIDLSSDGEATHRWLRKRGIRITDADGEPSLSSDHFDHAVVPHEAADDFAEFVHVRRATSDAGKLTELRRAQHDGIVYPYIDSYGAVTGRQAIRRPALQNLPGHLRPLLVAPDGMVLVGADLSHVEPSIAAALSSDPAFIDDVQPGRDPYIRLASAIWDETIAKDDPRRQLAKRVLLAAGLYGQGLRSLAYELDISEGEARRIRDDIFDAYPRFARWRREVMRTAAEGISQTTPYGRRLARPDADQAYKAVNYLVQGTAADYFKRATLRACDALDAQQDRLFLPVHDELIVATAPQRANAVCAILESAMSTELKGVRITADAKMLGRHLAHA